MNPQPSQPLPMTPEAAEPRAGSAPIPIWLRILMFLVLYGGMVYFDRQSGWFDPQVYAPYGSREEVAMYQPPAGGPDLARGKRVYENVCGLCHGNDGAGKPNQAPPFIGSDWVLGSPDRMIRIPLAGLTGPIKVKDQEWNLAMPAMGASLSDDDLAAVLTFIRQSWGNQGSAIIPEQVKAVRAAVGSRTQPWTAEELKAFQ